MVGKESQVFFNSRMNRTSENGKQGRHFHQVKAKMEQFWKTEIWDKRIAKKCAQRQSR